MPQLSAQVSSSQRAKLLSQNKQLFQQLTLIRHQLTALHNKSVFVDTPESMGLRHQLSVQHSKIVQLKLHLQSDQKFTYEYIIQQENSLKALKKQLNDTLAESSVLHRMKNDKVSALMRNDSLLQHEQTLKSQLKQLMRCNRRDAQTIVQLQRQLRKYHLMNNPKQESNINSTDIENIKRQKRRGNKQISKEWEPKIKELNTEYDSLAKKLLSVKESVIQKEKEHGMWVTRLLAMKEPQQIEKQKEINKLVRPSQRLKEELALLIKEQSKRERVKEIIPPLLNKTEKVVVKNDKNILRVAEKKKIIRNQKQVKKNQKRNSRMWQSFEEREQQKSNFVMDQKYKIETNIQNQ